MTASRRRLATALVMLMIFSPFASAGVTNWSISTPINPDDDGVTTNAFSVPNNETIVDGWISVNSNPMASSMMDSISISGDDFDNGTYDGATDSILDGNLTMFDDGSTSSLWNFDDNGNFSIAMADDYHSGPGAHLWLLENPVSPSNECGDLLLYNLTSGFDLDFDMSLDDDEVTSVENLCQTNMTIENGTGLPPAGDVNGTVQNSTVVVESTTLQTGNSTCPYGGTYIQWGNDFSMYYDKVGSLNSSEIEGEFYFCDGQEIWFATLLDLGGTISGVQQQLAHGVVPSSPSEGEVVVGTLPGQVIDPGTDAWFLLPSSDIPANPDTHVNYSFSFDHWHDLESGDGAWVEHRLRNGSSGWGGWTWTNLESGYSHSISMGDLDVSGTPASSTISVFGGDAVSGWVSSSTNLSNIPDITTHTEIQFRFRIVTAATSTGSAGWFLDNINYHNDGDSSGAWHHGCDVNGYAAYLYTGYCYYGHNQLSYLTHSGLDLTGATDIEFDIHWDLEGSLWDNTCIELSNNNGATWIDITSTSSSTATQCRSRSGSIPSYGYSDMDGTSYMDDSGGMVTILSDVPTAYQIANVDIRFVVQTDASVGYGSPGGLSDPDGREGLTVFGFRPVDSTGATLYSVYLDGNTPTTPSGNEWRFLSLNSGYIDNQHGFEDSAVTEPLVDDVDGFTRTNTKTCSNSYLCGWDLTPIVSDDYGPTEAASFPYLYSIGAGGSFTGSVQEASLVSPTISVPESGISFFTFEMWMCWVYNNWQGHMNGGALMVEVDGGSWEIVDAGWYTDTMSSYVSGTGYILTNLDGMPIWTDVSCGDTDFTSFELSMAEWAGSDVRFKFVAADKYGYSTSLQQGWYIDNVGVRQGYFSSPGDWISQPIELNGMDSFNMGIVEIEGKIDDNSTVTGSIIDAVTEEPIIGYESLDFPINLAGLDSETHPTVNVRLELSSSSTISTPIIRHVEVGGPRILSAELFDFNGWNIPSGVEVIDDLLNATAITSTITSDYIDSIRPIKRINFLGNSSSNVIVQVLDADGNNLANTTHGGYVSFANPINGYSIEVTLPPNGYIDEMLITPIYAEPARDVALDVAEDGSDDWYFPYSQGRGHLGWQTTMLAEEASSNPSQMGSTSLEVALTSGVQETLTILIPDGAIAHSGLLAITSDSDGFDSSINIGVNGYQKYTSPSDQYLTYFSFSPNQVASISAMSSSWTDTSANSRDWKEVEVTLDSSTTQTITFSRLAISYSLYETVSDLTTSLANYHTTAAAENPSAVNINIPTNITAPAGQVLINGQITHELMITNKDFSVPQVFYPDGTTYEIVTSHRHLYDNSDLESISLVGHASDGETISFEVGNTADNSWGMDSGSVTFYQSSGSQLMSLDTSSSEVSVVDGGDGWMEVQVTWKFDVSWNWNDLDRINWIAQAIDGDGVSIWPANSVSGATGNAVENDLQIDSFEIRDQYNRLISNQFSTFYPFPILEGSEINVTGSVRFQNSLDTRPMGSDFQVRLNLSGSLLLLDSYDEGQFSGTFSTPSGLSEIVASPQLFRIGPLSGSIGGEDVSGQPPFVAMVNDFTAPTAGPLQVMTPSGLQNANGKVWDPSQALTMFVTIEEPQARGETLTMHYWRADSDDANFNGIAEEEEYLSQVQPLSAGMTGEQQVTFAGIDVTGQSFNSPVHIYLEGTDWAGLTYQEGGTGGGPGAEDSWASVIIATDEPTTIVNNAFNLDRSTGYLMAGVPHTFTMQISEPNGLQTLDNITIMLCGDNLDNIGKISYNPVTGELWTADDSMVSPLTVQTQQITPAVIELAMMFEISWNYPWTDGQFGCKPSVSIIDEITEVAYANNIGELTWVLDNSLVAVASGMSDLTPPIVLTEDAHLYLRQGDEFQMTGGVFYAGSGEIFTEVPDDLQVEMTLVYGTEVITSLADVSDEGEWFTSMTLPMRAPFNPTMNVTTTVINIPGSGVTSSNTDGKVTVDSRSPTVLFDQMSYPDSSLTVLESDLLEEVLVSLTIVDEIGMPDEDLEVAWIFLRDNQPVAGTEDTGTLGLLLEVDGSQVFQGRLDFTPNLEGFTIENGDRIMFWVTSTDKAGNEIQGLGSEQSPRAVALRVMEFNPSLDNVVVTPKDPLQDTTVVIETYWSNSGKRDGTIEINLYELKSDGRWVAETVSIDLDLSAETSSVYARFEWIAGDPGQPVLYIIVDDDFDNPAHPVSGIVVQAPITDEGSDEDTMVYAIMGGVFLVAVAMVGFFVSRSRSGDDDYYYEDDDSYYEDDYEYDDEEYEHEDEDSESE